MNDRNGNPSTDSPSPSQPPKLRLDHFLKVAQVAATGGHAKLLIQSGEVLVNGVIETRRRRQLTPGDQIELLGQAFVVESFD